MKTKLLIFGITGDLGTLKLLPALEQIISTGDFEDLTIIGVSRREVNIKDLLVNCDNKDLFDGKLSSYTMNLDDQDEYQRLKDYLAIKEDEQLIAYLAVPPNAVGNIVDLLGNTGINTPNVKILFEKPFGVDLHSAQSISKLISRHFSEEQIYRIDHFLAKEMAQNIVTIRANNSLFSQIWENDLISSISIIATETIDIEGRKNFYEQTGALRDVIQGHLMQLLALTLMDAPSNCEWDRLPEMRLSALRKLRPADPAKSTRGQYEGYCNEVEDQSSHTETFASLLIESDDPKWSDVPIRLITGKGLDRKTTEIRVHIKKTEQSQSDCLVFSIQPNEGVGIELLIKKPGYSNDLEMHRLGFNYPEDSILPDAYERVIVDAMLSRKSLFSSSEEVIESWKILQPILDSWSNDNPKLVVYHKGSSVDSINSVE